MGHALPGSFLPLRAPRTVESRVAVARGEGGSHTLAAEAEPSFDFGAAAGVEAALGDGGGDGAPRTLPPWIAPDASEASMEWVREKLNE